MPVAIDPFDDLLRPPPDETTEERGIRLAREEEARQVSATIDASIKAERYARRKKRIVRLLLLGQSESGKSTTLRQFQRLYTPTAFREERILWRAVIQLNIVKSIRTILDALSSPPIGQNSASPPTSPLSSPRSKGKSLAQGQGLSPRVRGRRDASDGRGGGGDGRGIDSDGGEGSDIDLHLYSPSQQHQHVPSQSYHNHHNQNQNYNHNNNHHHHNHSYNHNPSNHTSHNYYSHHPTHIEALKLRLTAPIKHLELVLISKLVPPNEDEPTHLGNGSIGIAGPNGGPIVYASNSGGYGNGSVSNTNGYYVGGEVFVRPTTGWRGALSRARVSYPSFIGVDENGNDQSNGSASASSGSALGLEMSSSGSGTMSTTIAASSYVNGKGTTIGGGIGDAEGTEEIQETLSGLCGDMIQLWQDAGVRDVLKKRKIRLEECSGFFLNDLQRVTAVKYMPSDDDVLKARLKTVGVAEYKFEMEIQAGRDSGAEWRIVDVGGSRSQRPTWAPFFDDVDAIIFLAPISGFDQVLSEDRTVNRLEDSVLLWKAVCSNKLLAKVDLVLFLNKCDILDAKLKSGIKLSRYVKSYGDRDNDLDTVSKYMRSKFSAIHREHSPNPRKFYAFCTSVTDTTTTAGIIASVRDMVIRQHLKQSKLL